MLADILTAARDVGRAARIHLKVDTGLGRNGLMPQALAGMLDTLHSGQAEGLCKVVGVWSHLAWADDPGHPTVQHQHEVFADAVELVERAGFDIQVRHLSNSAATLTDPSIRYDLVRPGLAVYGLSPVPQVGDSGHFGLRPAMRLEADLALTKTVDAGSGVSPGHEYVTPAQTVLGLVPIGYADGVPRHASGTLKGLGAPVQVGARRLGVAGRVCMDQFMLDLGPDASEVAGETVVLFGSGENGEPTAQDWAAAVGTISYEIVTRIGAQVPRVYVGGS
jgi:alanine racemase